MAEEARLLTPLAVLPTSGDAGRVMEEEDAGTPPTLFGGRSGVGGGCTFSSSLSVASFSSVASRSAIRSAMRASRSLSSSSCRDSNNKKKDGSRLQYYHSVVELHKCTYANPLNMLLNPTLVIKFSILQRLNK